MKRSLVLAACALLLAACGGGGDGGGQQPQPAPAPVTQTVGAAGGTINGPDGIVVTIPPGALAADTQITIAAGSAGAPALPSGLQALGRMYSITPHGTSFGVPVTFSVPFDPSQLPAGRAPALVKTNARGDGWQQLVAERNGNALAAAATSFSVIGVFCCLDPIRIIDQPDDQTTPEGGFAFFRVEAIGFSPTAPRPRIQWLRNGVPMFGETNPEILIPHVTLADDNTLYTARVGSGVFEDSRAARLLVTPVAPRIVNQPLDLEVVAGQRATFNAASTSSVAQALQWQRTTASDTDFTDLANETATQLAFAAQPGDGDRRYRMCATNSAGMACSRGARLSVLPQPTPPAITQQPQPASVAAGGSASFAVRATGGSLSYRWETARSGGTFAPEPRCTDSATCTLSNAALGDDGLFFRVLVSNTAGSALSAQALLTVRLNPGAALTRVLGGNLHSLGLRADGTLRAWGGNALGQLGDGTFDARTDSVTVAGLTDVATLAAGANHTVVLRANGEVWTWGGNDDGELGDGTTTARAVPQRVPGLGPARAAAAGKFADSRSTVVLADGTVWSWGHNLDGQLGDGTTTTRLAPVQAGTLTDVVRVAAGGGFTLALRSDGSVWAWGKNASGQLGNGTTVASLVPTPVPMPAPIVAIAASVGASFALTDQGAVLAWGLNVAGEIGDGTRDRRLVPTPVNLPAPAVAITAGGNHVLALLIDGRVFAWGGNFNGQAGSGSGELFQLAPVQVPAPLPADIVAIGAGLNHSLALAADGSAWAWGNNASGQLNDGSDVSRPTPVRVRNVNLN